MLKQEIDLEMQIEQDSQSNKNNHNPVGAIAKSTSSPVLPPRVDPFKEDIPFSSSGKKKDSVINNVSNCNA